MRENHAFREIDPTTVAAIIETGFLNLDRELLTKQTMHMLGIDISKEPMLVYPTLHYQNGGINVNGVTETTVPGLYGAGEVIGGVHGENRRAEHIEFVILQRPDFCLFDMQFLRDLEHAYLLRAPCLGKTLAANRTLCFGLRRFGVRFVFVVGH